MNVLPTAYGMKLSTIRGSEPCVDNHISRKGFRETILAEDNAVGIVTCGDNNGQKTSVPCIGALCHEGFEGFEGFRLAAI